MKKNNKKNQEYQESNRQDIPRPKFIKKASRKQEKQKIKDYLDSFK